MIKNNHRHIRWFLYITVLIIASSQVILRHYSPQTIAYTKIETPFNYKEDLNKIKKMIPAGSVILSDIESAYILPAFMPIFVLFHSHEPPGLEKSDQIEKEIRGFFSPIQTSFNRFSFFKKNRINFLVLNKRYIPDMIKSSIDRDLLFDKLYTGKQLNLYCIKENYKKLNNEIVNYPELENVKIKNHKTIYVDKVKIDSENNLDIDLIIKGIKENYNLVWIHKTLNFFSIHYLNKLFDMKYKFKYSCQLDLGLGIFDFNDEIKSHFINYKMHLRPYLTKGKYILNIYLTNKEMIKTYSFLPRSVSGAFLSDLRVNSNTNITKINEQDYAIIIK